MKYLIEGLQKKLKKWYYYQEFKELGTLSLIVLSAWVFYTFGSTVTHLLFTGKGIIYLTFFMASIVIGLVIKIYYRLMEIKYYDMDARQKFFEGK